MGVFTLIAILARTVFDPFRKTTLRCFKYTHSSGCSKSAFARSAKSSSTKTRSASIAIPFAHVNAAWWASSVPAQAAKPGLCADISGPAGIMNPPWKLGTRWDTFPMSVDAFMSFSCLTCTREPKLPISWAYDSHSALLARRLRYVGDLAIISVCRRQSNSAVLT